jgi:hypothetical protein
MTRTMNKAFAASLMAASLLGAVSCGDDSDDGGPSDADQVQQVAEDYLAALADKDEERACELQIASTQEEGGCALHSQAQVIVKSPEFETPILTGDRANVLVTGSNGSVTLNLVREDDDWKVEEYQGQAANL